MAKKEAPKSKFYQCSGCQGWVVAGQPCAQCGGGNPKAFERPTLDELLRSGDEITRKQQKSPKTGDLDYDRLTNG